MICKTCGTEYEGIFCPNCGTDNRSSTKNESIKENTNPGEKEFSNEEKEKKLQDIAFYYMQCQKRKECTKENDSAEYYDRAQGIALTMLKSSPDDYRIWWEASKPVDYWNTGESVASNDTDFNKLYFDKALDLATREEKQEMIKEVDAYHQRKSEKKRKVEEERRKKEEELRLEEQQRIEEERRKREEEHQKKEKERIEAEKKAQVAREEAERKALIEEDRKKRTVDGVEYKTYEEAEAAREAYQRTLNANRNATVSLVCGILSLIGCIFTIPAIPLLIIGLIFSVKALKGETTNIRRAVAGMITSLISLLIVVVVFIVAFSFASEAKSTISKNEAAAVVTVETEKKIEAEKEAVTEINTVEEPVETEKYDENKQTNRADNDVKEPVSADEGQIEPDTSEYILPEADSRYYSREELEQLGFDNLRLARNEILARHGRIFETEDLKSYYSSKSWYQPRYTSDEFDPQMDQILNAYEKANIEEIKKIENGEGTACLYQVTVNAPDGYVNLREGAGINYTDLKKITNGVVLNVYAESPDAKWLQTEYQGSSGWVASSQVQK